jgi:hypothetical protein
MVQLLTVPLEIPVAHGTATLAVLCFTNGLKSFMKKIMETHKHKIKRLECRIAVLRD